MVSFLDQIGNLGVLSFVLVDIYRRQSYENWVEEMESDTINLHPH